MQWWWEYFTPPAITPTVEKDQTLMEMDTILLVEAALAILEELRRRGIEDI